MNYTIGDQGLPFNRTLRAFFMDNLNARRASLWIMGVAAVFFWSFRATHIGYLHLWDAAEYYYGCISAAAENLTFQSINCSAHPSAAYILPFALLEKMFPGQVVLANLLNSLLAFSAIMLFVESARLLAGREIKKLAGEEGGLTEVDLGIFAVLLSVSPFLQANTLHFNIDIGIFVFFAVLLYAILKKLPWLCAVAGIGLIFSKETGIIVFSLTMVYWLWQRKPHGERKKYFLAAAVVVWAAFLLYATLRLIGAEGFYWVGKSGKHLDAAEGNILSNALRFFDSTSLAYFHSIFTINFNWLLCLVVVLAIWRTKKKATVQVALFILLLATVITRYKTYNNVRYFLFIYPLIILAFCLGLSDLVKAVRHRVGIGAVVAVLLAISCLRTVDPVSKAVFGTFQFGTHSMLNMTSITKECCGYGLDQIVYNLEFTKLGDLQNKLFEQIGSQPNNVISQHELFRRSLFKNGAFGMANISPQIVFETTPPTFTYVLFPMIPEYGDREEFAPLLAKYIETGDGFVEDSGYAVRYLNFKRKE